MNSSVLQQKKPTLLIVDDEQLIIDLVSGFLSEFDYQIFTAIDAKQATNVMEQQAIDILITDHQMPEVTGLHLCQQVKENFPHTRMILTSGNIEQFNQAELSQCGVDLLRAKPISLMELANDVESLAAS